MVLLEAESSTHLFLGPLVGSCEPRQTRINLMAEVKGLLQVQGLLGVLVIEEAIWVLTIAFDLQGGKDKDMKGCATLLSACAM